MMTETSSNFGPEELYDEQQEIPIGTEDSNGPPPVCRVNYEVFSIGIPLEGTYEAEQYYESFYDFRRQWGKYKIKIKDRKVEEFLTYFYAGANYWYRVSYIRGGKCLVRCCPKEEPHREADNQVTLNFIQRVEEELARLP